MYEQNQDDRSPSSGATRRSGGDSDEQNHSRPTASNNAASTNRAAAASDVLVANQNHQGDERSFASFVSDTTPSAALAGISSAGPRTSRSSRRVLHDEGDDRPPMPRGSEDAGSRGSSMPHHGGAGGNIPATVDEASFAEQRSVTMPPATIDRPTGVAYGSGSQAAGGNVPTNVDEASFAEQRSVTMAPASMDGPTGVAYGIDSRAGFRDNAGAPKPMPSRGTPHPMLIYEDNIVSNIEEEEEEEDSSSSTPDIEIGRSEEDEASVATDDNYEEGVGEVEEAGDVDETVYPGAVAVDGPGGLPLVASRTLSSASQQQPQEPTEVDYLAHAQVVDEGERTLLYRLEAEVAELRGNQAAVVHAEEVVVEPVANDPPVENAQDRVPPNLQQPTEANRGLFHWFKSKKSRIFVGIVLVLVVVVVVLGVSVSSGGSSDASQTDMGEGPTASPPPSVEPVTTDIPTPEVTAPPEATPNPTPPPTVSPAAPDPTPPPTLPPTPPPTPLPPAPTLPPTVSNVPVSPTRELIQTVSVALNGGAALQNASSPQSLALEWLEGNANLPTYSDSRKIQRFVLATLYHSTNGPGWDDSTGWLSDSDECSWYDSCFGFGPCQTGQAVISTVCLYWNGLTGSIPPELALLSNSLDYLNLGSNDIGGSIPSELGLLSNLEGMLLWDNEINGNIPLQVGMLSKLTILALADNALTGSIPTAINSMTNLNRLHLYNNSFTGEFECPSFIDLCEISCSDLCCDNLGSPCRSL